MQQCVKIHTAIGSNTITLDSILRPGRNGVRLVFMKVDGGLYPPSELLLTIEEAGELIAGVQDAVADLRKEEK